MEAFLSRLLSLFLEYINIITAILVIMSIAVLVALIAAEPSRSDGLFLVVLIVLLVITVVNATIATLMTARRHLADIRAHKIRHVELLHTIAALSGAAELEAQKRRDMKYPTTNL